MAEDEDIEQDSEAYRKWRSGNDNDKYASSKTPTETGSKSGSYTKPKDDDDEYALPGEDDGGGAKSWLDGDLNWPIIIAGFVIFALIGATIFAFAMSSGESKSNPSEWPETEGIIIEQSSKIFIDDNDGEDYCKDENDDGWLDDWECWNNFVFGIDLTTQYSVDQKTYQTTEYVEFIEWYWVDELKEDGGENEERLFENFTDYWNREAANGSISLNSTISLIYNPENPKEAYSEFVKQPEDPMGFLGYFSICLAGMMCFPIIIVGIIITKARSAVTGGRDNRIGRWGPFGGGYFGNNRHHRGDSKRRHTPTRRSGGGGSRRNSGGSSRRSSGGGRRR